MKPTLQELRDQRVAKIDEAKALEALANEEDRDLTTEELEQFEALMSQAEQLKGATERRARLEDVDADLAQLSPRRTTADGAGETVTATVPGADNTHIHVGVDRELLDPTSGFRHLGECAAAIHAAGLPGGTVDNRLRIVAAASGMSQGVGADGGFAVPPAFSMLVWDGMNLASDNLLGRTDNYTVEPGRDSLTFMANAETSRAAGSRWGGARGYWIAEAAQVTSSTPTLRQVKLEPQELAVLVYVTDKLLRNSSIALGQYLSRVAADEINFLVGDAIINGTGAGQPKGIVPTSLLSVTKEQSQLAKTIKTENIVKMWARLHARSRANAVWFINQDCEPQLLTMSLAVGTGGVPTYMAPGGLNTSPYGQLLGRPVIPIEFCQTLGTKGDIILADMKAYASGTQGGVDTALSMHLRFDYAETAFRFMFAVDGQPWLASAITPFKGTDTLSPFVLLNTRA
jgi:HK97 family phage major capsid protein